MAAAELVDLVRSDYVELEPEPSAHPLHTSGNARIFYPLNLQVELTARCNLNCFYCYRDSGPTIREERLTTEELLGILDRLKEHGLQSVELTGGEPLMHPAFGRVLDFCGERFPLVALLTNGTCITSKTVAVMLRHQRKMVVSISLDSHRADVHDKRRGVVGAFERTTNAIRMLADLGFLVRVSMVVDEGTWPDVEGTLLLARSLGARLFAYTPMLPLGRGAAVFSQWTFDQHAIFLEEQGLRAKYAGFLQLLSEESVFDLESEGGCGAGYRTYAMDPQGRVRPCTTFDADSAVFGSLRTSSPIEVFGSPLAEAFSHLTAPHPNACGGCELVAYCQGCELRGFLASKGLAEGECSWLRSPAASAWSREISLRSSASSSATKSTDVAAG